MRRALMLCALLMLAACNRVHTAAPMFTPDDAKGAPVLRDGVWLFESEARFSVFQWPSDSKKPCRPDLRLPAHRWRDCAGWVLVRDGQMLVFSSSGSSRDDPRFWLVQPFLIARGDPLVMQFRDVDEALNAELFQKERERAAQDGEPFESPDSDYTYFGISTGARDAEGRVVAIEAWPALCGPHPDSSGRKRGEQPDYLTRELMPGLTAEGQNCRAASREVVLESIRRSREWESEPIRLRWIRDGET